jgi:hypothetical protein
MKNFLKNTKLIGFIILGILGLVGILSIINLFVPTTESSVSILGVAISDTYATGFRITSVMLVVTTFLMVLVIGLGLISIFKKTSFFLYLACFYSMGIQVFIFLYQILFSVLPYYSLILAIFNVVLCFVAATFAILRRSTIVREEDVSDQEELNNPETKQKAIDKRKLVIKMLILDIVSLFLLTSIFFVPLYAVDESGAIIQHVLGFVIFKQSQTLMDMIFFLSFLVLYLTGLFGFIYSIADYYSNKKNFSSESKSLIFFNLIVAAIFFLSGTIISCYYSVSGITSSSLSFISLVLMGICCVVLSILKGKYDIDSPQIDKVVKVRKYPKIESLIYVCLVTAVTFFSLFLNIIKVEQSYESYANTVTLTGIELLKKYASLGGGYQIIAFYLMVMMVVSGFGLLRALTSYLAKYKYYGRVAKTVTYANIGLMFMLGISGMYFSIAQEINIENLKSLLTLFGYTYSDSIVYSIKTDALYALLIDAGFLILMIVRKSFTDEETLWANASIEGEGATSSSSQSEGNGESSGYGTNTGDSSNNNENNGTALTNDSGLALSNFDPCPAFSLLDAKVDDFKKDLEEREKTPVNNPSLNGLINFVVDYAKDSRLHLSYSQQDVATFVSGLGACRLSVLQGMSGTGKTSLPKIFTEAIEANCEIIEVESSWKDKNELMGYYNEFSSMYTPKKFTQALYKACLNKEIPTLIVLDEMNLSRIEYYFSDFLSLMENEEGQRQVKLLNVDLEKVKDGVKSQYICLEDGTTLHVPANIWFIGTANRDESTFVISDKVYDRAHTMNFNKRAPKVRDFDAPIAKQFYSYDVLSSLLNKAKEEGKFDAEKNDLINKVEEILRPYNISFGNRILKQIEDFVDIYQACFPKKDVLDEAVETILLSKVVAKLEVKTIDDKEGLIKSFQDLKLTRCAEFIAKLNED